MVLILVGIVIIILIVVGYFSYNTQYVQDLLYGKNNYPECNTSEDRAACINDMMQKKYYLNGAYGESCKVKYQGEAKMTATLDEIRDCARSNIHATAL